MQATRSHGIRITCPGCGKRCRAHDQHCGKTVACPVCHTEIHIPPLAMPVSATDKEEPLASNSVGETSQTVRKAASLPAIAPRESSDELPDSVASLLTAVGLLHVVGAVAGVPSAQSHSLDCRSCLGRPLYRSDLHALFRAGKRESFGLAMGADRCCIWNCGQWPDDRHRHLWFLGYGLAGRNSAMDWGWWSGRRNFRST